MIATAGGVIGAATKWAPACSTPDGIDDRDGRTGRHISDRSSVCSTPDGIDDRDGSFSSLDAFTQS